MKKAVLLIVLIISILFAQASVDVYFTDPDTLSTNVVTEYIRFIDSAEESIDATIYQFNNEDVVDAFVRAADRLGPDNIRFITDDRYYHQNNYAEAFNALKEAGIFVVTNGKTDDGVVRGFNHHKFVIADKQYIWTGSHNSTDRCLINNANNALHIDSVELSNVFLKEFNQMYEERLFSIKKNIWDHPVVEVDGVDIETMFAPGEECKQAIIDEINNAEHGIYFCMFTFTDSLIRDALLQKAKEGIHVYGVYDTFQARGQYSTYRDMAEAAEEIPTLNVVKDNNNLFLHHKFVVIDAHTEHNPTVITGSKNWTLAADRSNDETLLIIQNNNIAKKYFDEVKKQFGEGFDISFNSKKKAVFSLENIELNSYTDGENRINIFVEHLKNNDGLDITNWSLYADNTHIKTFNGETVVYSDDYIVINEARWEDNSRASQNKILHMFVDEFNLTDEFQELYFLDSNNNKYIVD
ncbi:MAG: phospholipase D-like domain-containing protein [Candidatus Muiribacteriota bacterium]